MRGRFLRPPTDHIRIDLQVAALEVAVRLRDVVVRDTTSEQPLNVVRNDHLIVDFLHRFRVNGLQPDA